MKQETNNTFAVTSDRPLLTVERVLAVLPHDNADNLAIAQVKGWQCVVTKRDNIRKGDLVLYAEIDALLPIENPLFAFLREYRGGFARVKTVKLRGEVSQGIIFPLPDELDGYAEEGDDVTGVFGVKKYEPSVELSSGGRPAGLFPSYVPKTAQPRIQNLSRDFNRIFWTSEFVVTEKLDGSSITIIEPEVAGGNVLVCSHNLALKEDDESHFSHFARESHLTKAFALMREKLAAQDGDAYKLFGRIALQGELVAPKIQGNKYGMGEGKVYFFDAYDITNKRYLSFELLQQLVATLKAQQANFPSSRYGKFDIVPFVASLMLHKVEPPLTSLAELVEFLDTNVIGEFLPNSKLANEGKTIIPEGIVVRSDVRFADANRISFKYINPEFLLKSK